MGYYIDAEQTSLAEVQKRIMDTDLVPSREPLLKNIGEVFKTISGQGCSTLADLRFEIKNPKKISSFAEQTGISAGYLTLLRREIEGWFPKAFPVSSFEWISENVIKKIEEKGYKKSNLLFDALQSGDADIDGPVRNQLAGLVNLTRIQWVSPLTARLLYTAGYKDADSVAKAGAEQLYEDIDRVNKKNSFFKGKIGLRDVKRLIMAAAYIV